MHAVATSNSLVNALLAKTLVLIKMLLSYPVQCALYRVQSITPGSYYVHGQSTVAAKASNGGIRGKNPNEIAIWDPWHAFSTVVRVCIIARLTTHSTSYRVRALQLVLLNRTVQKYITPHY